MRRMGALLLLPLALSAQTRPDDLCSISGQVTNAVTGEPVRRALVYMRRIDMSPGVTNVQVTQSGTTDAAGRFALSGIAPGKYRLSAERSGFLTTQYGSRGPNKAGTLLTLEPGQKSSDMTMRLTPHGVIAGRVLDEEGEPVSNANVQVLRQQYMQGRKELVRTGGGSTNDLGEYRVFGLPPGRYFVSAESAPNAMTSTCGRRVCHHLLSTRDGCRGGGPHRHGARRTIAQYRHPARQDADGDRDGPGG